ncbi:anthranilate synthase component 1 [Dongshaea marina]|uniref:anthranilate synthase component 1 n=1 Tax=Dongshaea marina TaxID=2047966 RepID=UPI000D3E88CC|nr:anthranilate synthase component 1 [Dongshaea marina]
MQVAKGQAVALKRDCSYISEPLELFAALSKERAQCMLLESAEIDSKAGTQSILLIDACLRVQCMGQEVTLEPLTPNGQAVIDYLSDKLPIEIHQQRAGSRLILSYPPLDNRLDQDSRLKARSVLDLLRSLLNEIKCPDNPQALFLGGAFAFDLLASVEPLPEVKESDNNCPDYCFYLAESLLIIDHKRRQSRLMTLVFGGEGSTERYFEASRQLSELISQCQQPTQPLNQTKGLSTEPEVSISCEDEAFKQKVETLKQAIVAGEIFQVVPSRCFSIPCPEPLLAYQELKRTNPSPYMFYLKDREFELFGASPESAVKFTADSRTVEMYPIAGTRPRGKSADGGIDLDLDGRIELELRLDQKEQAEHLMLVDLARNDIARISEPGTRQVKELLKVDRYSHVMHLVSRVTGVLRRDLDALHAYQACMNMGTLTGAPKIRATELIRQTEQQRRGSYGGAVGYLNGSGDLDSCIVIRSALVRDGIAHVQAGGGVVLDSVPQAEADETRHKAAAVLSAIKTSQTQGASA